MDANLQDLIRNAYYAWLTTVRKDGMPQPTPVWFIWNESNNSILVLSQPNQQKLTNLEQNSHVAISWSNDQGYPFVVVMGSAKIDQLSDDEKAAYLKKYNEGIIGLGYQPEQMLQVYSTVIRISIDRVRGGA